MAGLLGGTGILLVVVGCGLSSSHVQRDEKEEIRYPATEDQQEVVYWQHPRLSLCPFSLLPRVRAEREGLKEWKKEAPTKP